MLLAVLLLAVNSFDGFAVPAKPGLWRTITLTDGSTVKAELKGDEFVHYYLSADGRCFVPSALGNGAFELASKENLMLRAAKRHNRQASMQGIRRKQMGKAAPETHVPGYIDTYTGVKKGIIILAQFRDKKFADGNNNAKFKDIANKENYTSADGYVGSLRDYFNAQSSGRFYIDFDVVGPVTLSKNYSYYGANNRYTDEDLRPGEMVAEACLAADNMVDFSAYDWNGIGEAKQVYVIYAGLGEASSDDTNTVWPHQWALQYSDYGKSLRLDGVTVDTYACSNELAIENKYGTINEGIGGICHEFSHCLGLPDFYDTEGNNFGMSHWDLMDAGSYNGDGFCPAGYTAYEKAMMGWLEPTELKTDTVITKLKTVGDGGRAFAIYNGNNRNELLLIENRQKTGWDTELYGAGLMVMHIDYDEQKWWNNTVNTVASRQRCTLFHADNNSYVSEAGLAGDPYPYNSNDSLTNLSRPRALFYNANTDGTKNVNCGLYGIKRNIGGTIDFLFKASPGAPTAIGMIYTAEKQNKRIYTTDGRYAGSELNLLPKGIYVVDGKKVVK